MSAPSDPLDPVLEIDELTVGFGDKSVVDGVSLRVCRGEVVALVGESGSGARRSSAPPNPRCGTCAVPRPPWSSRSRRPR